MTTTDTRIAELLGWEVESDAHGSFSRDREGVRVILDFTADLSLTVREGDRHDLVLEVEALVSNGYAQVSVNFRHKRTGVRYPSVTGEDLHDTAALAFLAALEAEKEATP